MGSVVQLPLEWIFPALGNIIVHHDNNFVLWNAVIPQHMIRMCYISLKFLFLSPKIFT